MAVKITLENTGEHNSNDYVSVSFVLDEEVRWTEIINKLITQGFPALGYVIPDTNQEIVEMIVEDLEDY